MYHAYYIVCRGQTLSSRSTSGKPVGIDPDLPEIVVDGASRHHTETPEVRKVGT